jgi:hypothetical protein
MNYRLPGKEKWLTIGSVSILKEQFYFQKLKFDLIIKLILNENKIEIHLVRFSEIPCHV